MRGSKIDEYGPFCVLKTGEGGQKRLSIGARFLPFYICLHLPFAPFLPSFSSSPFASEFFSLCLILFGLGPLSTLLISRLSPKVDTSSGLWFSCAFVSPDDADHGVAPFGVLLCPSCHDAVNKWDQMQSSPHPGGGLFTSWSRTIGCITVFYPESYHFSNCPRR